MIMHQNNRPSVRGRDFCSAIIIKIHLIDCFKIIIVVWHCFMGDADYGVDFLPEYFNLKCGSKFQNLVQF